MNFKEFLNQFFDSKTVDSLLESINQKPYSGLRLNPLKMPKEEFYNNLEKHPIINNCFIFDKEKLPLGKHIYHDCGCYYIQEPSAMLVGHILNVNENDKVLDLCAAPGGKSTFVAPKLTNGVIYSNDVNFSRSLDLLENIERMGIKNCYVMNEKTSVISDTFSGYFDKVILDAPCSGEGMFRKNDLVKEDWTIDKVLGLVDIQKKLIMEAYNCLKYGGYMTYSTCTFNSLEDEQIVKYLLENTNAKLVSIEKYENIDRGINMQEAIRIFPYKFKGEGHFIALIQCLDEHEQKSFKKYKSNVDQKSLKIFKDFVKETLNISFDQNRLYIKNNNLYLLPENSDFKDNINILKYGLYLGEVKDKYFIPSHHLACALNKEDWKNVVNLSSTQEMEIKKYLKGEANFTTPPKNINGYGIITIDDIPLGLIKISNNQIKNLYPKKLRKTTL